MRLTTPREDGYWMPGEFEPHAGCWMLFPERSDVWGIDPLPAQIVFADVAAAIARFEPVTMCVSAETLPIAKQLLPSSVAILEIPANDAWMRDCGPTFVVNGKGDVRGIDWEFNAWGGLVSGLYHPWDLDNAVAHRVLESVGAGRYKTPLKNEGGALTVDGDGTLITTRSVLLNANRNPDLSEAEVETILRDYLGVEKIIWLDIDGLDETDGHVDGVCAFVAPGKLLFSWNGEADTLAAYEQLCGETDAKGRCFEIIKIPEGELPLMTSAEEAAILRVEGTYPREAGSLVWGGYINFYIANGGIVFPMFGVREDGDARQILQDAFPEREVVGVPNCRAISICGGNIHCITQQQPK